MSVNDINNNVRIRTTPLGSDKYLKVNLNQNFDFLEILSLKIGQEQIYKQYCSDYGVIVGRVVCNEGVGVPNAKVSIFIPISEEDSNNPKIRALYPYENLESVDFNNIKYNLLLEAPRQDDLCHRSVGTFPEKRRILDCDPWCEVFGKYYKFTTSTNASGDYMIFGVPTGVQTVHMDVDLSDIGYLSQKPYDMVNQGSPNTMFDSLNQFKTSPNLAQLPQIKTQNKTINVLPFWGDLEQCQVGINRVDFDLNYKIVPSAFFIGSIFGDSNKNAVSKRCRPRPDLGLNAQLNTGEGRIDTIRRTPNGGTESFDVNGGRVIDEDGTWIVQLPMNLETKITDEFGNLVDSGNPQIGIATKAKYRFKIGLNEAGTLARLRARAKFLVPNYGDYSFDDTTPDTVVVNGVTYPNFTEMEWNGVYTVKEFISRFSKRKGLSPKSYTGIKDTANSGNLNPFPYNSISQDVDFLFIFLCLVATILGAILTGINAFISAFNGFIERLASFSLPLGIGEIFGFLREFKIPCVAFAVAGTKYCPGCDNNRDGADWCEPDENKFFEAVTNALAVAFDIFKFNFIEDWINGSLYAFSFKLKDKPNGKSKFCSVDVNNGYGINYITSFDCGSSSYIEKSITIQNEGIIKFYQGEYFYAPLNVTNSWLYPTDIYNLGSMKSCDILGKPKIVLDIPPTTFNLLSEDFGVTECDENGINCVYEQGTEPFLLGVNCIGITTNLNQCVNTRRFCELGVDYDEDLTPHDLLGDLDISDIPAFGPSLLRGNLECLNVPSICTDCTTPPDGQFTDDWKEYRTGNLLNPGTTNYSESSITNLYQNELIRNSFYFYFGITPGKTAIDKLLSQYFAPCERSEPCPIFIEGNVTNNTCLSGDTGSITAVPKYGTPPYRYDWYLGYYLFGGTNIPFSLNGGDTISNLYSDIYTVVVSDSVGNICKKSFTVLDPSPFIVSIDYSSYVCPNANNGYIYVTPGGGTPPYTIDWSLGADVTQFNTSNTNGSFFLTGLGPTSVCNNSSVGSGVGGSGSGTLTQMFSVFRPTATSPFLSPAAGIPNINFPVSFPNIISNPSNGYGNGINTPVTQSDSFFTAQSDGTYQFTLIFEEIIVPSLVNPTFNCFIKIYDSSNNLIGGDMRTPTFNTTGIIQNHTVLFNPIPMLVGQKAYVDITYGTLTAQPNDIDGRITWNGALIDTTSGGSGSGGGGNPSPTQYYNAVVWDSAGSCQNIKAYTIDITQSCGFSLTATSVDDYCSASTRTSITAGITGGGVPPFTFVIQSTDTGYFWSGKTSDTVITKKGMEGLSCPGATYNITCIDSCGAQDTVVVNVVKTKLRSGGYFSINDTGKCYNDNGYRFYVYVFEGPGNAQYVTTTNASNSSGQYSGMDNGGGGLIQLGSLFYALPMPQTPLQPGQSLINPITNGVYFYFSDDYDCGSWTLERRYLNSTQDRIYYGGLTSGYQDICKNSTFIVNQVYGNAVDIGGVQSSIKIQGCSDIKLDANWSA
jgi:hypothetical protein